jgi:iron(III) transport system permease protein
LIPAAIAVAVSLPAVFVLASLAEPFGAAQAHLWSTNGPRYVAGTLLLCAGVGLGAGLIGAATAALVALTDFPGRRWLSPALAMPFAVPAYVAAYAYADFFSPFGAFTRWTGLAPPEMHGQAGAAFILTFALYPYVYLATRASLAARSAAYVEAARMLGAAPVSALRRVLIPAGRAAFAGGLALALMETAADYGVADYLGAPTLSVGIFRVWHGMGDLVAAAQLAACLLLIALVFSIVERASRRGRGVESARARRAGLRLKLGPLAAFGAFIFCATPPMLGFALPVLTLAGKLATEFKATPGLAAAAANTAFLGLAAASIAMTLALLLAYAERRRGGALAGLAIRVATIGYAAPGAVIAIGVLGAAGLFAGGFGVASAGTLLLVYAYVARFLTAGFSAASGGLAQIHPMTDEAARTLGAGKARIFARIDAPLARPALIAGFLVVFIDVAKELPATLLLRDFNFETLATRTHRLAADERIAEAAPSALALIAAGVIATLALNALDRSSRSGN